METTFHQTRRHPFLRFLRFMGFGIMGIIGIAASGFLFGYFVMLLWNWLMPGIFGIGLITFWQAVGLVILGRMLLGGLPRPPHHHHKPWERHKCDDKSHDWKKWKYYGQYWKEQGEQNFNEYIKKKEEGGQDPVQTV